MSRPKPAPPEASHGWTALQTYPDEHVAYALLLPNHPALPAYPSLDADVAAIRAQLRPPYVWSDPNEEVM